MTLPEENHCDIPSKMPKGLERSSTFKDKKQVIEEHIIKKERDLRIGGVCHNTQLEMLKVIEEEYAGKTDPEVLKKLEKYLPGSLKRDTQTFTLDTFYNTVKIQKEYNDIIENNTYLVYSYFGGRKFPSKLKVDGIAGKDTGVILDFLLHLKEKRDKKIATKSETIKAILEITDIRQIGEILVQKVLKRFLTKINGESQKMDISLDALYDEISSIAQEIHLESYRNTNPFIGEVRSFFEHFFGQREKGKKLIKILLSEATGKKLSDNERISGRLEILSGMLGFTIDTAKNNTPEGLGYKFEQLKKIPALGKFISSYQGNSQEEISTYEQNFSKIIQLIPKLASFLNTQRVVDFFDKKLKPEIEYLLTHIEQVGTSEFQKRADGCIVLFAEFIKTEILPSVEQIPPQERKQILDDIFSISFLKDLQDTQQYKLIVNIVGDSGEGYFPVVKSMIGLFQKLMKKEKFKEENRKELITLVEGLLQKGEFSEQGKKEILECIHSPDIKPQALPKLQELILKGKLPKGSIDSFSLFIERFILSKKELSEFEEELKDILGKMDSQEKNALIGKLQKYLEQTGEDAYSFLLWFLKSGTFKFSEDMFTQMFFNLAGDTIKTGLSESLIISTYKAREVLLSGKETYQQAKTPVGAGLDVDILQGLVKLLEDKSKLILQDKKVALSKKEILTIFYREIEVYLQKKGVTLSKEYIKFIVDSIVNNELGTLAQDTKSITYLLDRGILTSPKDEKFMMIDFFVDYLYQLNESKSGNIKVEDILTQVAEGKKLHSLLSVKILGAPLIHTLLYIVKKIPKSELKLILFENSAMLLDAANGKLKEEALTKFGVELIFDILKKVKIERTDDIRSLDFFIAFIQKGDLESRDIIFTIERGRKIFSLLESNKKHNLSQEAFWKLHGEDITLFSRSFFTLMQKFLKAYGKGGVEMLLSEKIYKSSSSLEQGKQELMKGLESLFKYSNIFKSFFTLVEAGFDDKKAETEFMYTYFTNSSNMEDFRKKIFTVAYKKTKA